MSRRTLVPFFALATALLTGLATTATAAPVTTPAPAVDLAVRVVVHDRDHDGLADPDETLTVVLTVTNIGDVTLTAGVDHTSLPVRTLAPGGSAVSSYDEVSGHGRGVPYDGGIGLVAYGLTSDGQRVESAVRWVTVLADTSYVRPDMELSLTGSLTDENGDGDGDAGETVAITSTITNAGPTELVRWFNTGPFGPDIRLEDVECSEPRRTARLAPGEQFVCHYRLTITPEDVAAGVLTYSEGWEQEADGNGFVASAEADLALSLAADRTQAELRATPTLVEDGDGRSGAPNRAAAAGERVRWSFMVSNTGTTPLRDPVVAADDLTGRGAGIDCPSGPVAPQQSVTCRATPIVVTEADVARARFGEGRIALQATVALTAADGSAVTSPAAFGQLAVAPRTTALAITGSSGRWSDADHDGAFDVGETVRYRYVVTNTGTAPFRFAYVTADPALNVVCPRGSLAPGRSVTCSAQQRYRLTAADVAAHRIEDRAFASGLDAATGLTVSPTVSTTVSRVPAPRVTLSIRAALADRPGGNRHPGVADLGEPVEYRYRVANTGNVALHGVDLRSSTPTAGSIPCPRITLAPGAVMICRSASGYSTTQDDVDRGVLRAAASITALSVDDATVSARAAKNLRTSNGPQRLALSITGELSGGDAVVDAGETVRWTYVVTNRGPRTVSAVGLTDRSAGRVDCPSTALAPGESLRCVSATGHVVTAKEARRGVVRTSVRATAHRATDEALVRSPYATGVIG